MVTCLGVRARATFKLRMNGLCMMLLAGGGGVKNSGLETGQNRSPLTTARARVGYAVATLNLRAGRRGHESAVAGV